MTINELAEIIYDYQDIWYYDVTNQFDSRDDGVMAIAATIRSGEATKEHFEEELSDGWLNEEAEALLHRIIAGFDELEED